MHEEFMIYWKLNLPCELATPNDYFDDAYMTKTKKNSVREVFAQRMVSDSSLDYLVTSDFKMQEQPHT